MNELYTYTEDFLYLPFPMEAEPEKRTPERLTTPEALKAYGEGRDIIIHAVGLFDDEGGHTWTHEAETIIHKNQAFKTEGKYKTLNFKDAYMLATCYIESYEIDGSRKAIYTFYAA